MSNPGDPHINSAPETPDSNAPTPGATADSNAASQETTNPITDESATALDYKALARFLLEPLIDQSEELHISSEITSHNRKVSLRVSLGQADRGRAFGRGGRNIRAIRTILRAAGQNVGQNVSLEIIGGEFSSTGDRPKPKPRKAGEPRPSKPKPKPKR